MVTVRTSVGAALLLAVALLGGCGKTPPPLVPVAGVVLVNGEPLPKARVRFIPPPDKVTQLLATGVTDDDGRFTLKSTGKPGACVGEFAVTVDEDEFSPDLTRTSARGKLQAYLKSLKNRPIPPAYKNAAETPLKVTVSADQQEYKIELERAPETPK